MLVLQYHHAFHRLTMLAEALKKEKKKQIKAAKEEADQLGQEWCNICHRVSEFEVDGFFQQHKNNVTWTNECD
eukprot:gene25735-11423_t